LTAEYRERRKRLGCLLEGRGLDALIVSSLTNIRYLCGFTGSSGVLFVLPDGEGTLWTDPRYQTQAARESDCRVRVVRGPLLKAVLGLARRRDLGRLGFESDRLTVAEYEQLREGLWLGASLEPEAGLVEKLRMVKSAAEVEAIRRSMLIASEAFQRTVASARPGVLEIELAAELEYQMRRLGAEKAAFDSIVLSGERTAQPHGLPGANRLAADQLLLIDAGAVRDGYSSDMTRMAFLGEPGRKVKQLYRAVREAQEAGVAAVRPGVTAGAVDAAARRVLRAHGCQKAFLHSTGHGLGLEIHEPPRLGRRERTRLVEGMTLTVEPGVYIEGFGGIRIEDTVVVTSNGCQVLTPASKELLLL
jgi:Xaa-Pro aminopeptidase